MPLPSDVVDPHHHFIDPANEFQGFLCGTLGAPAYTAEMFTADLGPLHERVSRTVHVEAIPDDGLAEATVGSMPISSISGPVMTWHGMTWHV